MLGFDTDAIVRARHRRFAWISLGAHLLVWVALILTAVLL